MLVLYCVPVKKHRFLSDLYELLSSMRFAVGLLSLLAISAVIGTVLKQNERWADYAVEFGPFWFEAWRTLGLYDVYHAVWFLLILGFLVLSTSVCILRHAPGFVRDMRSYRERARRVSLAGMHHTLQWPVSAPAPVLARRALAIVQGLGYRARMVERDGVVLIAAKAGAWQRSGYFMAHIAIVLVCIGGLVDGNLPYQVQSWLGLKQAAQGPMRSDVPLASRLSSSNISFRGDMRLAEGQRGDVVFLQAGQGYFVQELPFSIELKRFYIEHYSTGQPKRFASDIVVVEHASGKRTATTLEVNKPLTVAGITIYQASFGDGGSALDLALWDGAVGRSIKSVSQASEQVTLAGRPYALEFGDFRLFNIEPSGSVSRQDDFTRAMTVRQERQVQNVGPSISYKLRDQNGQAQEYQSYMAPILIGKHSYWVTGVRDELGGAFRFLQVPLDDKGGPEAFMRLRAEMNDAAGREEIAQILAGQMLNEQMDATVRDAFRRTVVKIAQTFADGGFPAMEQPLKSDMPAAQRQMVLETNFKILLAYTWQAELRAAMRAGLPAPAWNDDHGRYLTDALQAMSDWKLMRVPGLAQLTGFAEVKASGLQLTRSPGKTLVYLGSLLLLLGTVVMFYVRERRLWIHLQTGEAILAMSANRPNEAFEAEFEKIKTYLPQWLEEDLNEHPV